MSRAVAGPPLPEALGRNSLAGTLELLGMASRNGGLPTGGRTARRFCTLSRQEGPAGPWGCPQHTGRETAPAGLSH